MPKIVPSHLQDRARKCIFCGNAGLSRTHIWPSWLNELLTPGAARTVALEKNEHKPGKYPKKNREIGFKQGSIFSQKPRISCRVCNNGWMNRCEDSVRLFAIPLFMERAAQISIGNQENKDLALWCALIVVLAEFMDVSTTPVTSDADHSYLFQYNQVPPHWSLFVASADTVNWRAKYRHHTSHIAEYRNVAEYVAAIKARPRNNTLITSMGIGHLFVQALVSYHEPTVTRYRRYMLQSGMLALWPPPVSGNLSTNLGADFPTALVIDDGSADYLSDAFSQVISRTTVTPEKI